MLVLLILGTVVLVGGVLLIRWVLPWIEAIIETYKLCNSSSTKHRVRRLFGDTPRKER